MRILFIYFSRERNYRKILSEWYYNYIDLASEWNETSWISRISYSHLKNHIRIVLKWSAHQFQEYSQTKPDFYISEKIQLFQNFWRLISPTNKCVRIIFQCPSIHQLGFETSKLKDNRWIWDNFHFFTSTCKILLSKLKIPMRKSTNIDNLFTQTCLKHRISPLTTVFIRNFGRFFKNFRTHWPWKRTRLLR